MSLGLGNSEARHQLRRKFTSFHRPYLLGHKALGAGCFSKMDDDLFRLATKMSLANRSAIDSEAILDVVWKRPSLVRLRQLP